MKLYNMKNGLHLYKLSKYMYVEKSCQQFFFLTFQEFNMKSWSTEEDIDMVTF